MHTALIQACQEASVSCSTVREVDLVKSFYLGKKSTLHQQFLALRDMNHEERKNAGAALNITRDSLQNIIDEAYVRVRLLMLDAEIAATTIDATAPMRRYHLGGRHPINLARQRLVSLLHALHFEMCDGPEIEDEAHNFTFLNVGAYHPARAEQDTFYLAEHDFLLRTHTSPVQIRMLKNSTLPLRIMAPGRVYRADMDATHTPMFHQLEGMVIDKNIHMGHLKGMIVSLLKRFFDNDNLRIRFRPGYFPFTEPSAEVDIWHQGKWLEVLGSGMIHPAVLEGLAIDPSYRGYAFGLGIDRLAMLRYGISDLRMLFENDYRLNACFTQVDV